VATPLQLVGLSEKDVAFELTMEDVETINTPIHVLVEVPEVDRERLLTAKLKSFANVQFVEGCIQSQEQAFLTVL
jgi:hypothetical protein